MKNVKCKILNDYRMTIIKAKVIRQKAEVQK